MISLLALLSCDKESRSGRAGGAIEFSVMTPDMLATKAEVMKDELTNTVNPTNLYIYDEMLAAAELDMAEFYGAYSEEKIQNAITYAKDLKDRYTVLWLYYDLFGGMKNED